MERSKEDKMMGLFFDEPTKEWHFEEIVRFVGINRKQAARWLKIFQKERLIKRVKLKNKMPFYAANYKSPDYQNKKRIFALTKMYKSGFLNHLVQLPKVKAVILFGSFVRWDWHKNSDIDLFIYGDSEGLNLGKYELALNRDIQVFECPDDVCLKRFPEGLLKNILKGDIIKGTVDFLKVGINA